MPRREGTWTDTTAPSYCLVYYHYGPPPNNVTARAIPATIILTANHPYSASADGTPTTNGDYMDATLSKPVSVVTPLTIVHGWGDISSALFNKWSEERDSDAFLSILDTAPLCPGGGGPDHTQCIQYYRQPVGGFAREKTTASWLAQFSRAARLNAAMANAVPQVHHALGVVYGDDGLQGMSQKRPLRPASRSATISTAST